MSWNNLYDTYACGPVAPEEADSPDKIIRELTIGKTTERDAVRRIENLIRAAVDSSQLTTSDEVESSVEYLTTQCTFTVSGIDKWGANNSGPGIGTEKSVTFDGYATPDIREALVHAIRKAVE